MNVINNFYQEFKRYLSSVDLVFLLFLISITNVSLIVKVSGVLLIYIVRFQFKFNKDKLPLFYPLIALLLVFQTLFNYNLWNRNYFILVLFCAALWLISYLVINQIQYAIEKSGTEKVKKTIEIFFILNTIISLFGLLKIMFISKSINPFGDIDMNMYYGMSTGDHILGIFRDFSATNSCISVLGFVYFLFQRKYWLSILCLIVVLITTSNINIAILVATIISLFIFYSNRFLKTLIICFIAIVVVFFIRISPNNLKYFADKLHINFDLEQNKNVSVKPPIDLPNGKEQKALTDAEKKDLAIFHKLYTQELLIEKENERNRYKIDSLFSQQQFDVGQRIVNYSRKIYGDSLESVSETKTSHDYGKILSFQETLHYLFSSPSRFILGAGAGQYSSKLAFKVSGIGVYGNFPLKYQYVSEEFKNNHLRILTYYFIQPPDKHSATNTPYSVFNQIIGEYGILGFALFVFFYVFFFLKRFKLLSYGKVLLPIMLLFFVTDYWFENLSVVIIFELLMLLDMTTTTTLNNKNDSSISQ